MSNTLTDTMHAAQSGMNAAKHGTLHALGTARDEVVSAKDGTLQSVASVLSTVLNGVTATARIITTLQKLDRDQSLAWLGLARRKSPLRTIALVSAGVAVGAGLALWFAPMKGAELRRALTRWTRGKAKSLEGKDADEAVVEPAGDAAQNRPAAPSEGANHDGRFTTAEA